MTTEINMSDRERNANACCVLSPDSSPVVGRKYNCAVEVTPLRIPTGLDAQCQHRRCFGDNHSVPANLNAAPVPKSRSRFYDRRQHPEN